MNRCHISVSIEGALARSRDPHDIQMIKRVLGYNDVRTLRADLEAMKAEGYEVIPFEDCDNQAKTGHCLGHSDKLVEGIDLVATDKEPK
jgi:hypothetical protein